jgi:hypothetical protein
LLVVYGQSGKIALQLLMSYGSGQYSPTMKEYTMHCTMSFSRLSMALILGVWLCTQFTLPALAQDRVRAKVGIQVRSGERTAPAKTTETVKTGDSLRVYVMPEDDAYIYVVHNDGKTPNLLNAQDAKTKVRKGASMTLPAPDKFYQVDGTSDKESITVICSPTEIREVASLFSSANVPTKNWLSLEKELLDKSKLDLTQPTDKPFQIAGNVRSINNDSFVDTLQIVSGKSLVVKKYDFQVQK